MVLVQFCHRLTPDTVDDLHPVGVSGESVSEKRCVRKVGGESHRSRIVDCLFVFKSDMVKVQAAFVRFGVTLRMEERLRWIVEVTPVCLFGRIVTVVGGYKIKALF